MKISMIVPVLNEAENIVKTLASGVEQELDDKTALEMLVVDGGSSDETCSLVRDFAMRESRFPIRLFSSARGRATQMNFGAQQASGDALLFLHADTRLSKNAIREMAHALCTTQDAFGYFFMKFDSQNPLTELYSSLTLINSIFCHYGDSGIFVRRSFFNELGGFPEQALMEDVELLFRARAKSDPLLIKNAYVTTSARRFEKNGFLEQQMQNGLLLLLYLLGVDATILKKLYS
ncbi:glycosyl transferase family 2 [Chloroherpeton thalassium ATCC 35110]|uniref:Glycosyl transferase family 2 n=1 Tax=Chloroherpeton thalassium (strain ATCC 35110 / GB-78) TaxID=517418 RepID=B3QU25_CHLT3|nr:TIGR04283 family arsenosugar biosynthesis glycosyltransferase [Chloroherpeton thalassium]ACF12823.1 glycosyl transferase family 2 [Chloroherpeton thalassium ATCC 35110]